MKNKLERPERLAILAPPDTLHRVGLRDGMVFADIGAGTGVFTFAAAKITNEKIYAVDISEEMQEILTAKKKEFQAEHVDILSDVTLLPAQSCDMLFLCTVLHEIPHPEQFLQQAGQALKRDGIFAVIEFHKRETGYGPPTAHRLDEKEALDLFLNLGYSVKERFTVSDHFYCLLFEMKHETKGA